MVYVSKAKPKVRLVEDKISRYQSEYTRWLNILEPYHTDRFDVNYRQYTAYASTRGTHAKISDPVASELVERVLQKLFERKPTFFVHGVGTNLPKEITNVMANTLSYLWDNPNIVEASGTRRSKLKVIGREFGVTGNVVVETFYDSEAECPDFRVIPIEDVIFDPTKTIKTSGVYYIRQWVSLEYLKSQVEVTKDGRVVSGIFKNLDQLEQSLSDEAVIKGDPNGNYVNRSGSDNFERPVDEILLITRWEGKKCCRIANWVTEIQNYENDILGEDPLDVAMDIEVPKQPYAFSMLDFINGLTKAKDLILNQVIDYGSKALNPPLFVDPNLGAVNRQSLRNAFKVGGIVFASPNQVGHQPMPTLPNAGFDFLTYSQQRSESVVGISPYLGGMTNAVSDKTQGTKGGIEALISQSTGPVADRQLNLEESLIEPISNKFLKYAAALMGKNEVKDVLITGESVKWVKATKGLLEGKIKLADLITAELISQEDAQEIYQAMVEGGINPQKELIFDADWKVQVEAGSMADKDSVREIESFDGWVAFNAQFGVPMDLMKVSKERALRAGIKEPEQFLQGGTENENGQAEEAGMQSGQTQPPPEPPKEPSQSISFKDLPPDGQIQLAAKAGIRLAPESVLGPPPLAPGVDLNQAVPAQPARVGAANGR